MNKNNPTEKQIDAEISDTEACKTKEKRREREEKRREEKRRENVKFIVTNCKDRF